ncbi:MAG: LytTR family transcriptional regulator DNA-binding domain-containing protein [Firmicutes bacterium]|nr:LytTR family transcriptional regulator DNA-binding domain-containing protein [Bacillota bacterium]
MKVRLFQYKQLKEEHIDIYYKNMSPTIEKVITMVENESLTMHLCGKTEKDEQIFINTSDIYYFECVDKRTFAYMEKAVYQVKESLLIYIHMHIDICL